MRKQFILLACTLGITLSAGAQLGSYPESYKISSADIDRAKQIISAPLKAPLQFPNPHPNAQWFPDATLGLFLHWGIHSVVGAQPSWDMISNYRYGGRVAPPDQYYALAERFNPQDYHPEHWLRAARDAGFNYAVLTTKHHDGYALWPSEYGIGTKQYMAERDLLREYVAACRAEGLKVGFYFSPRDWHYPGLMHPCEYDALTRHLVPPITDSAANREAYERFLGFVIAQMHELLTQYGTIDLLWLDGMHFTGINDMHTEQIYAWIRSLQPGIVINDRWANVVDPDNPAGNGLRTGDFVTPFECQLPSYTPALWWEHCDIWTEGVHSGWGYDATGNFRSYDWFFEHLVASRSLGGNFLPNVGPNHDGEMHPHYYSTLAPIAAWMKHSGESVLGAGPTPGVERSNVMITTRGDAWYLHLLPHFKQSVTVRTERRPTRLTLLHNHQSIPFSFSNGFVYFSLPAECRTEMDDVVKMEW